MLKGSINPNDNVYYEVALKDLLAALTHPNGTNNAAYMLGYLNALTTMTERPFAPHVFEAGKAFLAGDSLTAQNMVINALKEIERGKQLS